MAFPLVAVSAKAGPGNSKQNNIYKASITGNVLLQEGDDYSKEKVKTSDVIEAILDAANLNWDAKKCDLVMELGPYEEVLGNADWWIYFKDGKTTLRVNVNSWVGGDSADAIVFKRKYTAKGDNGKIRGEFTEAYFWVNAAFMDAWVYPAGTADVTLKGLNDIPFLNNVKLRTSGNGMTEGDDPLTLDIKVKGRVKNDDFYGATPVVPVVPI